jgi:hypothetical protein
MMIPSPCNDDLEGWLTSVAQWARQQQLGFPLVRDRKAARGRSHR